MAVFRLIELDRFRKVLVIDLMCESEKESRMTLDSQKRMDRWGLTDSRAAGGGTF